MAEKKQKEETAPEAPPVASTSTSEARSEARSEAPRSEAEAEPHPRVGDLLDEDFIREMPRADLQTVAGQRGYLRDGRRTISAEEFIELQRKDDSLRTER